MAELAHDHDGGVSKRAVLIAFVLLILLSLAGLYVELVHYLAYRFAGGVPPIAPMALVFILAAANPLWARLGRGALSRRELLVIYAILTVGAPLMSHGLLFWWLSCSIGQRYFAGVNPAWERVVFPHTPEWFCPTDWGAVEGFFQGQAATPWSLWLTPLLAWGTFYIALYLTTLFLVLLVKRQWINHERLTFPLAMVPLEMVRGRGNGGGPGHLPHAWVFWVGFLLAAFLKIQGGLAEIFPSLPEIPIFTILIPWQKVGPLAGLGDIWLVLWPWAIALSYLLPKELSFSVWFFWIVRVGLTVSAIAAGATPRRPEEWPGAAFPAPALQGGGAVLALGAWSLWAARRHIQRALRSTFIRPSKVKPAQKPFADRWVVIGFLVSFSYLVYFCSLAGARTLVGLALVGLIVAYYMVWARLRAENGMSFIAFPFMVDEMLLQPFGSAVYRPAELVTINATRWSYFCGWGDTSEVTTGASLDAFKIADSARISQRRLTLAMIGGFIVALAIGIPLLLAACYRYGFLNMHHPTEGWVEMAVRQGGMTNYEMLTNPSTANLDAAIALGSGGLVAVLLGAMRLRFWWWPFHPVGYLAANVWGSQWWYMPAFVGWILKTLAIRYGGLRFYQRTIPMAIGVIVGDRLVAFLWPLVVWLARAHM